MKTNYKKHEETFTEFQHLLDYVYQHNIKDYKYKFSFTYGYELYYWPARVFFLFGTTNHNQPLHTTISEHLFVSKLCRNNIKINVETSTKLLTKQQKYSIIK